MSALAKFCLNRGIKVSGSDKAKSHITEELVHLGADVFYKHSKKNVNGVDLLVFTCAVGEKNVEVEFAKKSNIPVLERADFLGKLTEEYDNVVAIAGSHGKTTVCGMLASILIEAKKEPTILVGGETSLGNLIIGKKDFLIVEACEYREHFLKLNHSVGVILNIDYDHPDFFKTRENYEKSFQKFAKLSKKQTFINEKYSIFIDRPFITFGDFGNFEARHKTFGDKGIIFDVYKNGKFFVHITTQIIGYHNVLNILCAIAVADYFNINKASIKNGIAKFKNLKRRYEYMGKLNNNIVITDYAHHPTQIKDAIVSTKEVYKKPITVVFEPHTYTRTKFLFSNFVDALSLADNIIILPTYSAREKSIKGGTSRDLFEALQFKTNKVGFLKSYKKCKKELEKLNDNIILILGAGSVIKLATDIKMEYLKSNNQT